MILTDNISNSINRSTLITTLYLKSYVLTVSCFKNSKVLSEKWESRQMNVVKSTTIIEWMYLHTSHCCGRVSLMRKRALEVQSESRVNWRQRTASVRSLIFTPRSRSCYFTTWVLSLQNEPVRLWMTSCREVKCSLTAWAERWAWHEH